MEFGVFLLMQSPTGRPSSEIYGRAIEVGQAAEELGFAKLWIAEHHFLNYSYSSRPLLFLSHLAARTARIRLGTAILPLSLHHPLIVAEELAALDVLSGGRLEVGVGKGYQRYQFERLGIAVEDAPWRYAESLEVLQLALSQRDLSYYGKVFRFPTTRLYPEFIQSQVPFWMVVNTTLRGTVADAVGRGANLFTGGFEPISRLLNVREAYPDLFTGTAPPVRIGTQRPTFVCDGPAEALRAAEEARWHARVSRSLRENRERVARGVVAADPLPYEPENDTILEELVVAGTPERCIRQIQRIERGLGADYYNCSVGIGELPQDAVLRSMERFAREVMPAFGPGHSYRPA
jgi:alkanesulfonate monooxygenase SsuD/methylene tetrahydromethanopterin reductase-like flavin-dependent oxidoreductase (luciferase family)